MPARCGFRSGLPRLSGDFGCVVFGVAMDQSQLAVPARPHPVVHVADTVVGGLVFADEYGSRAGILDDSTIPKPELQREPLGHAVMRAELEQEGVVGVDVVAAEPAPGAVFASFDRGDPVWVERAVQEAASAVGVDDRPRAAV
jgi:hypothetical protein